MARPARIWQRLRTSPGDAADDLVEAVILGRVVIDLGPGGLAQADQQHLHQAAFDGGGEVRVRLDAVADQHVVGLHGEAIEMERKAFGGAADDDGLRAGADGAADGRLGDAVGFQQAALAFGGAAAVAAHGGDQKGCAPRPRRCSTAAGGWRRCW